MNRLTEKVIAIVVASLLLVACREDSHNIENRSEERSVTNIIKVLNEVQCINSRCDQPSIDAISKVCWNKGYTMSLSNEEVISSRPIKERIKEYINSPIKTTVQRSDENGIVYDEEVLTEGQRVIDGYCIGSEYIIRSRP